MNYIQIAKESIKYAKEGKYVCQGKVLSFPEADLESVEVISPELGKQLLEEDIKPYETGRDCIYQVVNADSFQAARVMDNALVMNFANAHVPGGGFLLGATAQEEALCRCSTLYASIHSKKAEEMYHYNNTHLSAVESDYMLLSKEVYVYRDEKCVPLEEPVHVGVITLPAPNRYGAAMLASLTTIRDTMKRRIRIMLRVAMKNDYRCLVLGAWGCGAFGNHPGDVAGYFHEILVDEGYGKCFDRICFAIYGKENGRNIEAFREVF